jgi:hypothetical protein
VRNAGNRRERLAAKAEARHPVDRIVGKLGRRVALECEVHFPRVHAAAVVGDLDQFEPAGRKPDRDLAGAGIERIFKQLFQRAGRALHHLARGDAIHELGGQPSY